MTTRACSTEAAARPARLWLVRHGQSTWNVAGRIQGQSPAAGGLTAAGQDEAARAARQLAVNTPSAGFIVASDLPRAAETARIIADRFGWPVAYDQDLREQRLGALEGRRLAAPRPAGPGGAGPASGQDAVDALWRDPYQRPPGGESVADMYLRVHRALARLAATRSPAIVVTHGGPVRMVTATGLPTPGRPMPRRPVANASVVTVALRADLCAQTEMVAPWPSATWAESSSNHMPPSAR
jgi:probable phosphoglycerate mutase